MITQEYHNLIKKYVKKLQRFANRIWFPPLLVLLAILDALIIIIPTDGILISSSMLMKRRWIPFALSVAIGSTIGALILIYFVDAYGMEQILSFYPGVNQTDFWKLTLNFFNEYGLLLVFLVGVTPLSQQPALIIAALSSITILPLAMAILISRLIKFSIMAYVASHTPRLLKKFWGVKNEMKDAGIKIN